MTKLSASVLAIALAFGATSAQAIDFKLPSRGASASSANAGEVTRNARNALFAFASAEAGLAAALGGYNELSAQQKLLEGMKVGDAAAKKDDLETLVTISKSAGAEIDKKMASNAQLDAKNKTLAGKSMVEYVRGLVAAKKTLGALSDLAKNPMSLGGDAGTVLFAAKEVPGVVSGGASTTSALFKFLGANGVDLSEAKSAANDLGK